MIATLAPACAEAEPYSLRLHVAEAAQCDEYEPPLRDAIDFWWDHQVPAFTYDGCDTDVFANRILIHWLPEFGGYTGDVGGDDDHVPVYVVDEIVIDDGAYRRSMTIGAALRSHVEPCPLLATIAAPRSVVLAHELGHLVWLDHSTEPDNLMRPNVDAEALDQVAVAGSQFEGALATFEECRRRTR